MTPDRPASAATGPATTVDVLHEQALAWRILTHTLDVRLRRRLIELVTADEILLGDACEMLHAAGLTPLPRPWTLVLGATITCHTHHPDLTGAHTTAAEIVDRVARRTLGEHTSAELVDAELAPAGQACTLPGPCRELRAHAHVATQIRATTPDDADHTATAARQRLAAAWATAGVSCAQHTGHHTEPDPGAAATLDPDTDAPLTRCPPPAPHGVLRGDVEAADLRRRLAEAAYEQRARDVRRALISGLVYTGLGRLAGEHRPYALIDDLLRELGLPGLPRAHLYRVAATVPVTVPASSNREARRAAYRLLRDAAAHVPQNGLPLTGSMHVREPEVTALTGGGYAVAWHETYLVSLRATHAPRLAEAAVRIQLSILADTVAHIAQVPLHTRYLGRRVDHRLDPDHD
ncbi:hypothetical protein [Mangrovihabitans endophyticus]|uniref:Uncharacterized protein n=1 Tax=Mangrovihabitans endophyticus TaxID=1751298 RepID=A0A8J3FS74_9ACTN|nr:hypothetical protein [Mangrovihabitans endophyticus]GGL17375.1 hypothetical protein GCM10012284_59900 [Mangrovihabitans endophyticus]